MSAGQGSTRKATRKQRSDKKRHVGPTISIVLKDTIHRLSYITDTPVKDVGEAICISGMKSRKVVEYLAQSFRREIRLGNTLYMGDLSRPSLQRKVAAGKTERISIRFHAHDYEGISALAYALDVSPTRATALLLDASIRNSEFLNDYVRDYLRRELDERRMEELRKVMRYLRKNNPYEDDLTWTHLLTYIYDEVKDSAQSVADGVGMFISRWR
ncbi:hypothetical protein [Sporosarcina newyorkensis]|uniref:Uncharacterized protein n=1 Tax=Sporosarcina newyorkensis TaxID=759851 RepID=A0A1T4XGQ6_9BACL|nr:hypothetical protein [Sporosarcina newyorkensis]SKA88782.1 hypothetical protein SAMN04244570_0740 [Sporosarcina newyorkensis]